MEWRVLAGVLLGWGLGANDAANAFGTAVSSHMLRWRTAAVLMAISVTLGALVEGEAGLLTYARLTSGGIDDAFFTSLAAAITTLAMTAMGLPISISQATVGSMLGVTLSHIHGGRAGWETLDLTSLGKVVLCWIGTPIGAALITLLLYPILARLLRLLHLHFLTYDALMRTLLVVAGIYSAYALGANNVANVTGVFYRAHAFHQSFLPPESLALLVGGASIALGTLTGGKGVMETVGRGILPIDAFSAFLVVLSEALTVHFYAAIGVPVSTSQAVVGAVVGIGFLKGLRLVSGRAIVVIFLGWLLTPVLGFLLAFLMVRLWTSDLPFS